MPSSLNKFRFGVGGAAGEASNDPSGNIVPAATPATGKMAKLLIASLRFMSVY